MKTWYKSSPQPLFCGRCGRHLTDFNLTEGYDFYTGKPKVHVYLSCPLAVERLSYHEHDVWEVVDDIVEPYIFDIQRDYRP